MAHERDSISSRPDRLRSPAPPTGIERPARALIGWMTDEEARLVQAGRDFQRASDPEFGRRAQKARAAVARRPPAADQHGVLSEAPPMLQEYFTALRTHPVVDALAKEGWRVAMADLQRVCAIQPSIFSEAAEERVAGVDPDDGLGLASLTIPVPQAIELPAQYDQVRQAWMLTMPNPNLKIIGQWGGEIQPGVIGFGFAVQLLPSFVQVASLRGRYILRDGYHRAYGLLRRGVTSVPVLARDFPSVESLALNPGMLPQDAYLGERPAFVRDYLDDSVAVDVMLPASQKMIVIQGLELTPLG